MEMQIKAIKIPRPKYNSSNGTHHALKNLIIPQDPPRDYDLDLTKNCRQETQKTHMEDLQRNLQEKL
jgi:hypothetical protein